MKSQQELCTREEALALRGRGSSYFHGELREGLMVPPVIPGRCQRFAVAEVMACTEAVIAGWSTAKRRELVVELLARRLQDMPATPAKLAQQASTRYEGIAPARTIAGRRRAELRREHAATE